MPTRYRSHRSPRSDGLLDDPFALVEASRSPPLPSSALRRHLVSTSDPGGHLIQSRCFATGGRQVTLTLDMHVVDFAPGVGPTRDFGQAGNAGLRIGCVK